MIRVQWHKRAMCWTIKLTHISGEKELHSQWYEKELAVLTARHLGRMSTEWYGGPAQLLIYTRQGRIGKGRNAEASYGCNSKSPG